MMAAISSRLTGSCGGGGLAPPGVPRRGGDPPFAARMPGAPAPAVGMGPTAWGCTMGRAGGAGAGSGGTGGAVQGTPAGAAPRRGCRNRSSQAAMA